MNLKSIGLYLMNARDARHRFLQIARKWSRLLYSSEYIFKNFEDYFNYVQEQKEIERLLWKTIRLIRYCKDKMVNCFGLEIAF